MEERYIAELRRGRGPGITSMCAAVAAALAGAAGLLCMLRVMLVPMLGMVFGELAGLLAVLAMVLGIVQVIRAARGARGLGFALAGLVLGTAVLAFVLTAGGLWIALTWMGDTVLPVLF